MTIIDLTKKESTLHKVISFPDGQQDVVITGHIKKTEEVLIQSRFNSFKDLEVIICAANALRRLGVKERNLYIPYLLGARSDREFQIKDPITDDGTKKSKKGLLCVTQDDYNKIICYDCVSKEEEEKGLLKTIFKDSKLIKEVTLQEVRNKLS